MSSRKLNQLSFCALAVATLAGFVASPHVAAQTTDPWVTAPQVVSIPASIAAAEAAPEIYVAYPVTINNGGGSAISDIRISGKAIATSGTSVQFLITAAFNPIETSPFVCSQTSTAPAQPAASIDFECTVPAASSPYSLASGQKLILPVVFKVPATRYEGDSISFNFTALFREGGGGGSASSAGILTGATATSVTAFNPDAVAVLVNQNSETFYTGTKGVPQAGDKIATKVQAPVNAGVFAKATITEASVAACPVPGASSCTDTVNLSILDKNGAKQVFINPNYLVILLRRDSTAFKGNGNNVIVYYSVDGAPTSFVSVDPCVNGPDPLLGLERCIYDRRVLKKNDAEVLQDPQLFGDLQITILAKENGLFAW